MTVIKSLLPCPLSVLAVLLAIFDNSTAGYAQKNIPLPVLQIRADQITTPVSPMLYGLMTEEINYSYEGGLYGELIRNRTFKASTNSALFWTPAGNGVISLDPGTPLNSALDVSLKLDAANATAAT